MVAAIRGGRRPVENLFTPDAAIVRDPCFDLVEIARPVSGPHAQLAHKAAGSAIIKAGHEDRPRTRYS
jgi:hypothetical protein